MVRLPHALALLIFSSTVFGCEEDEAPSIDSADFAAEEREARCAYLVRCGFATDRDACLAAYDVDRNVVQAIGSVEFDKVEYDPEAAFTYIELLNETNCDATIANVRLLEEARAEAFEGLVEGGGECFADEECAGTRSICDQTNCGNQVCCVGSCTAVETLSVGSSCPLVATADRLTAFCEDTAYCAPPPDDGSGEPPLSGTCQPRVDNGSSCDRNEACLDGQRCAMGECFILSTAGQPCNPTLQTGSCIEINQVCDMASSTCVDAPGDGQPCVFGGCQPFAQCVEDVCRRRPGLGESCENTPPCQGDLECRENVCVESNIILVCVDGDPPPPPEQE